MAFPKPPDISGQLINGHAWDYSSIEITAAGIIFVKIQSLDYTSSMDVGTLRGTSSKKLGRTRGQADHNGTMAMYKPDALALIAALAAKEQGGYMEASFDIQAVYGETGVGPFTDSLIGCRIVDDSDSHSQGSEPLVTTFQLDIMEIAKNGLSPTSGGSSGAGVGAAIGGLVGGGL